MPSWNRTRREVAHEPGERCCYPPVARKENLDRLAAFLPSSKPERELWTEIHEEVQEQAAALEETFANV